MPAMTMVFRAEPEIIAELEEGEEIEFVADRVEGRPPSRRAQAIASVPFGASATMRNLLLGRFCSISRYQDQCPRKERFLNRTIATIATISALSFGGAAFADAPVAGMGEGYDMLKSAMMSDFERLGIPTDKVDHLTLGQVAAIKGVIESENNDTQTRGQIEAIISNN